MIALLPLDDRPCNTRFPAEIAAIGGADIVLPPNQWLGRFNAPGDPKALQNWLENLPEVEALIVSIDMLAYGGLVASRKTTTSLETAWARLETLKKWRQSRPHTPIYAFNILMRLAITMDSDAAVPHYYNVMRYARLVDEAARFPSPEKEAELREVEAQIPPEILDEYRGARARNHAVNLGMLDCLAQGVFDFLLVTQEDCTEFGLHRREQDELTSHARELGVEAKFALHPGADEAALTLLAHSWNTQIRFAIEWSCEENKRQIAVFEDVPYEDALHSHIEAMGGQIVESQAQNDADCLLFVNAPVGGSQKDESDESKTHRAAQLEEFCERIAVQIEAGRPVALCDVAFPNGADDLLLSHLEERQLLGKLTAFSGWNTAGNTTGTVLAQCAAHFRSRGDVEAEKLNQRFVFERLVDDWGYQARVRSELEKEARQRGFSPLNMNGQAAGIEAIARRELNAFARELAPQFGTQVETLDIRLPWGRTFEVEVGAKLV